MTVKDKNRLDVRKYYFSQSGINVCNQLYTDGMHASSVDMFENRINK